MICNYLRFVTRHLRKRSGIKVLALAAFLGALMCGGNLLAADAFAYKVPTTHRADINLNEDWRFIREEVSGAQASTFDDAKWEAINLPHTWNNLDGQDGGTNYYRGPGWYRKQYKVDRAY